MSAFKLSCTLTGHEQDVRDVKTVLETMIVSGLRDATVRIWQQVGDTAGWSQSSGSNSLIAFNSPSGSFVNAVGSVNTPEGLLVAGAGKDGIIYLCEAAASDRKPGDDFGKLQLVGHEGNICSLDAKDNEIISSSWDATAKVWDLNSCSIKYDLRGHESSVWDAKILDENTYLTCSADRTIRLWSGGHEVDRFIGHTDVVRKLLILPGGKLFASCSNDCTIKIWDLETGNVLQTLHGHESFVYDLALLPNGDIVSTAEDRTFRVWRNGVVIQAVTLPCISVWCVTTLPNGDIAVGGSDNIIRVFTREESRVAPEEVLQEFKDLVQKSSIAEESLEGLKKTDIPGYEALQNPGKQEGETIMVKNAEGTIEAHQWSTDEWLKIGDVLGSSAGSGSKKEFNGQLYDYVFDVDIEDGAPPLKLPFNANDNPYYAAQKFLSDNELPSSYTDEVVRFIMKNTEGFKLDQQQAPADNPYADRHPAAAEVKPARNEESFSVLPVKSYIYFKEYKADQLTKGLTKFNAEQPEDLKLSQVEVDYISSNLWTLPSKEAYKIITECLPSIIGKWSGSSLLIGFDLLRACLSKLSVAEIIKSETLPSDILKFIDIALNNVNESTLALYMMVLKIMNNLVGNTLFIQIFINPSDDGKYRFNEYFEDILEKIVRVTKTLSSSATATSNKHYATSTSLISSFIYNLSVYHLQTSLLNTNPGSNEPVIAFIDKIGETLILANREAAYRLFVGVGNYKYDNVYPTIQPWLSSALESFSNDEESRFKNLTNDMKKLQNF